MDKFFVKIKSKIKFFIKLFFSKKIINFVLGIKNTYKMYLFKKKAIKYYNEIGFDNLDLEKQKVFSFLKNNNFNLFPYDFIKKYDDYNVDLFTDKNNGFKYSYFNNKKIYFKNSSSEKEMKRILTNLILVQDEESPHKYLDNSFDVKEGDIVVDLGAAEGDFSLSVVDKAKKVYLFETDPQLIDALKLTFEPWKEKVEIVNKYISNKIDNLNITIDKFFENKELPTFIKVDIEGAEYDFIQGARDILSKNDNMKIVMATYHKYNDEVILRKELEKFNFDTKYTKGYMLSIWDGVIKEPYFRRSLIRAIK